MKRKLAAVLLALTVLVAVSHYANMNRFTQRPITVGFIYVEDDDVWHRAHLQSLTTAMRQAGFNTIFYRGKNQGQQIDAIMYCVSQRVDAIVILPIVELNWDEALAAARAAGIPVLTVDRYIKCSDDALITSRISADTYEEGAKAFNWLDKYITDKKLKPHSGNLFNVVILEGRDDVSATMSRQEGFKDAMLHSPRMDNYNILESVSADYLRNNAKQTMTKLLNRYGNRIDIVFAHNDEMGLGAIEAIESFGKKPGKDIMIISIDGTKDAFWAMMAGKLNCTVECNPLQGKTVVSALNQIFHRQTPPHTIFIDEEVFPAETAAKKWPMRQY